MTTTPAGATVILEDGSMVELFEGVSYRFPMTGRGFEVWQAGQFIGWCEATSDEGVVEMAERIATYRASQDAVNGDDGICCLDGRCTCPSALGDY